MSIRCSMEAGSWSPSSTPPTGRMSSALTSALAALRDTLGDEATVDAAAVIGNFNQMNRLADATGMPVGPGSMRRSEELRAATGIERFHAHTR